jgi:hypothetical protein
LRDKVLAELSSMQTSIRAVRRTVNGYAIVIDACDIRKFLNTFKDNDITIQKDSMLFIELWKGEK